MAPALYPSSAKRVKSSLLCETSLTSQISITPKRPHPRKLDESNQTSPLSQTDPDGTGPLSFFCQESEVVAELQQASACKEVDTDGGTVFKFKETVESMGAADVGFA
ncbi:unnamed protein product [Dovyalis caffra]|uniref:Uncharacterized protein n=1 Tax=Dovyalis caffra TaxID=77055 RepID=A0AAV1QVE2_9ROSI|nr:unnamed protein product [Dovyalis caffra]